MTDEEELSNKESVKQSKEQKGSTLKLSTAPKLCYKLLEFIMK